jgi:hypothetical protein
VHDWRFHAADLLTGRFVTHDLPLSDPEITWDLSGPSALTGTLAAGFGSRERYERLPAWGTAVYAEASGEIRWGGILTEPDPSLGPLALTCIGFAGYPHGMIWTGDYQSPDAGVDPLDVVRMIWQHLQSFPDGDLGVTVSDATSPVRLGSKSEFVKFHSGGKDVQFTAQDRYQLKRADSKDCGGEIDNLASEAPFDYRETHAWDGDGVSHDVELGYPRVGRRRNDLRFVLGENLSVAPAAKGNTDYANEIIANGAGQGEKMLTAQVGHRDGRVRRTALLDAKDVHSKRRLTAQARRQLALSQRLLTVEEIDVRDHPNASLGSVIGALGDDIYLTADLGWTVLDGWWRSTRVVARPQSGDAATLTVQEV